MLLFRVTYAANYKVHLLTKNVKANVGVIYNVLLLISNNVRVGRLISKCNRLI